VIYKGGCATSQPGVERKVRWGDAQASPKATGGLQNSGARCCEGEQRLLCARRVQGMALTRSSGSGGSRRAGQCGETGRQDRAGRTQPAGGSRNVLLAQVVPKWSGPLPPPEVSGFRAAPASSSEGLQFSRGLRFAESALQALVGEGCMALDGCRRALSWRWWWWRAACGGQRAAAAFRAQVHGAHVCVC